MKCGLENLGELIDLPVSTRNKTDSL